MFVLHETYKAVQENSSPAVSVFLVWALIMVIAIGIWAIITARK